MTDAEVLQRTQQLLDEICSRLGQTDRKYLPALTSLRQELTSPCVLAVAGKVKSGKSFLINALLGVDLAMTGSTETTATINVFKKGTPPSKATPVLCCWVDGRQEWKPRAFLDSLQGIGDDTLRLTAKIDRLVFLIDDNPLLSDVTLVDTPGIGASVGEDGDDHQIHTDAYFQLRERHQWETVSLSNSADAVIYLFNTVPTETDKTFVASLHNGGHGLTALNGIGVLSKIDRSPESIQNVGKYAAEFEKELFTIRPASAALYRLLPTQAEATTLQRLLRSGFSAEKALRLAISSERMFLKERLPDCSLTQEQRRQMLATFSRDKELPWTVFQLTAAELYTHNDVTTALTHLRDTAGIEPLGRLLRDHFFSRSKMLRTAKILASVDRVLKEMLYQMPQHEGGEKRAMHTDVYYAREDSGTLSVRRVIRTDTTPKTLSSQRKDLLIYLQRVQHLQMAMDGINNAYLAWQKVVAAPNEFSDEEQHELWQLLSAKAIDVTDARLRQRYWMATANMAEPGSVRESVARVARMQYARRK